ncbi:protein translocase subunit SecF [Candidatus Woesebacteria bacterium]|nr:protein translocase subunit SecF [Candidatus Woesebacteria bacterium]
MNFIKYNWLFFILSGLVIIPGLISLALYGVRLSVDFTGGSLLEIKTSQPSTKSVLEEKIKTTYQYSEIQSNGQNQFIIRGPVMDGAEKQKITTLLEQDFGTVDTLRFESIGPTLSKELVKKTLTAIAIVAIVIMTFIARQFKEWKYGICAILAMLHDSLVLLGSFSLLGHFFGVEVDVLFVTAVLTTLSFSVHDTIVVYHRIREVRQKQSDLSTEKVLNAAVVGTLVRSLNNSLTIILMLTALYLLGGETVRWFALALLIGAITGTYSSTCTAIPLLYVWEKVSVALKKRR